MDPDPPPAYEASSPPTASQPVSTPCHCHYHHLQHRQQHDNDENEGQQYLPAQHVAVQPFRAQHSVRREYLPLPREQHASHQHRLGGYDHPGKPGRAPEIASSRGWHNVIGKRRRPPPVPVEVREHRYPAPGVVRAAREAEGRAARQMSWERRWERRQTKDYAMEFAVRSGGEEARCEDSKRES